ncbi:MAG: hypothetical protein WBG01_07375 [Bacteroidota bacterium]
MQDLSNREVLLLHRVLDGALSDAETDEFYSLLAERPKLRREYESLKALKDVMMGMQFKQPPEESWDRYWVDVVSRIERALARLHQ